MSKKSNNKLFMSITAILVILCIGVAVIGGLSKGFTDWDAKNWGKKVDAGTEEPVADAEDNNGMVIGDVISNGVRLSAMAAEAGGITVTATIYPETATDKSVTWTFGWANSAITDDVADFISVTPASAGSLTATVDCLQAFGNQIKIRVESNANPEAFAELTVDYAKRVSRTNVTVTGNKSWTLDSAAETIQLQEMQAFYREAALGGNVPSDGQTVATSQVKGTGTVDNVTVSNVAYSIKASAELKAAYAGASDTYVNLLAPSQFNMLEKVFNINSIYDYREGLLPKNTGYYLNSNWNNIVTALSGLSGHAFELKITTTTSLGTVENVINITIDKTSIGAQASSVALSQSNIIF